MTNSKKAAVLMAVAALFLSFVPLAVKLIPADSGIPTSEKLVARGLVATLVTLVLLIRKKESIIPGKPKLLLLRVAFGTIGMILYFTALETLPLADTVIINRLSPFFVLLFSWMFLKESLKKAQVFAIIIAFSGVALVTAPQGFSASLSKGIILALISAVFAGAAYTTLRGLRKYDSPLRVVFWFSFATVLVFLPFAILNGKIPTAETILPLLGIGVAGVFGQIFMTAAYRYSEGAKVAIYGYLGVVFSILWQILFFKEIPPVLVSTGALLVIAGGWVNYKYR